MIAESILTKKNTKLDTLTLKLSHSTLALRIQTSPQLVVAIETHTHIHQEAAHMIHRLRHIQKSLSPRYLVQHC